MATKRLKVNDKDYARFEYTPYFDRNTNPILRPKKVKYDLGDVVYIKAENSIGVVLGCIDHETKELRTDMDGMQAFSQIEPATKKHFKIKDVRYTQKLYDEIFGLKYTTDEKFHAVYCKKTIVAKAYVGEKGNEVRVLQGMDRMATIEKIERDCPEFLKQNDWTVKMRPMLFAAPSKSKRK